MVASSSSSPRSFPRPEKMKISPRRMPAPMAIERLITGIIGENVLDFKAKVGKWGSEGVGQPDGATQAYSLCMYQVWCFIPSSAGRVS